MLGSLAPCLYLIAAQLVISVAALLLALRRR